jgi:hypothetical protein
VRQSVIWELFGDAILSRHSETACAYLGDRDAQDALGNKSILTPTMDDFRGDPAFDPNPHGLDLPTGCLDLSLFVHSLAVWGPDMLIRSAFACATMQMEQPSACPSHLVPARDDAFRAVKAFIESPTDTIRGEVVQAVAICQRLYAPYEDDPDSTEAQGTWSHLGAPWFAAETAAQDYRLKDYDGPGPREASVTWCRRNVVWPQRAAESAAGVSSYHDVHAVIRTSLLDWILNT